VRAGSLAVTRGSPVELQGSPSATYWIRRFIGCSKSSHGGSVGRPSHGESRLMNIGRRVGQQSHRLLRAPHRQSKQVADWAFSHVRQPLE